MKEKYRLLFFKYIYYLCELQKYEKDLISEKIEYIKDKKLMCIEEKECYYVSKYFYLLNSINIDNLNLEEKEFLEKIDSHLIDKSVVNFLEETYSKVLISKNASGKLYYGPFMEQQYEAAADDIVLGLKYDVYGLAKGSEKTVEQVEMKEFS